MSAHLPPQTPETRRVIRALRRQVRWLTALGVLLACAVAGLTGYLLAVERPLAGGPGATAAPAVAPSGPRGAGHPTFDCRAFTGSLAAPEGEPIAELRRRPAGARVQTRGKVMQAFPRIMGLNWLHLCDAAGGEVLVVATRDWAHPGDEVRVEGVLSRDRDIGGVYVFPLLVEGELRGPAVIEAPAKPGGIDL